MVSYRPMSMQESEHLLHFASRRNRAAHGLRLDTQARRGIPTQSRRG